MTLADDRRMPPATFDLLFRLAPRSSDCVEALRSLMISCSLECQEIEFDSADATTNGPFILLLLHTFIHRHVDIDIHKCTHGIANRDRDKKYVTTESQIGGECVFTVSHWPSRCFVAGVQSVCYRSGLFSGLSTNAFLYKVEKSWSLVWFTRKSFLPSSNSFRFPLVKNRRIMVSPYCFTWSSVSSWNGTASICAIAASSAANSLVYATI